MASCAELRDAIRIAREDLAKAEHRVTSAQKEVAAAESVIASAVVAEEVEQARVRMEEAARAAEAAEDVLREEITDLYEHYEAEVAKASVAPAGDLSSAITEEMVARAQDEVRVLRERLEAVQRQTKECLAQAAAMPPPAAAPISAGPEGDDPELVAKMQAKLEKKTSKKRALKKDVKAAEETNRKATLELKRYQAELEIRMQSSQDLKNQLGSVERQLSDLRDKLAQTRVHTTEVKEELKELIGKLVTTRESVRATRAAMAGVLE